MTESASIFDDYQAGYKETQEVEMTMEEYLALCKTDKSAYANPWERLLKAIGEPEIIDYSKEPKLRNVFENLATPRYPAFADFYGMEDTIKQVVAFIRGAAQGGEESKQILYLLGPVGSAKSSLAKRLTELMEQQPFYAIKGSPVLDNPLSAFDARKHGTMLKDNYGVDPRYLKTTLSPWAVQEMKKNGGDLRKLKVVKIYPSINNQMAISRVEAADKNNQDVSAIVGKVDMAKLEQGLGQADPKAYGYSGGLCRGHRGIMEYVEMFKSPIDTLTPLLYATQDRQYNGTEAIGAIPFEGLIIAHSNEAEWGKFKNDKTNEAFINRCKIIKVPYTLRLTEENKIYKKYVRESMLSEAPCAPGTTELQAKFAILSRLSQPFDPRDKKETQNLESKMRLYDGDKIEEVRAGDPKTWTLKAFRDNAYETGAREGFTGWSVRDSFKALSDTFNFHAAEGEVAASPIDLMFVLTRMIKDQDLPNETRDRFLKIIDTKLKPEYAKALDKEIRDALVESSNSYGQTLFERYMMYANMAVEGDDDFIDPLTKSPINRAAVIKELESIEKPAGISNPENFRSEMVRLVDKEKLRSGNNTMPSWKGFKKFADAVEEKILGNTKDLSSLISFVPKNDPEEQKKHNDFVGRMLAHGWTPRHLEQAVKWHETNKPN